MLSVQPLHDPERLSVHVQRVVEPRNVIPSGVDHPGDAVVLHDCRRSPGDRARGIRADGVAGDREQRVPDDPVGIRIGVDVAHSIGRNSHGLYRSDGAVVPVRPVERADLDRGAHRVEHGRLTRRVQSSDLRPLDSRLGAGLVEERCLAVGVGVRADVERLEVPGDGFRADYRAHDGRSVHGVLRVRGLHELELEPPAAVRGALPVERAHHRIGELRRAGRRDLVLPGDDVELQRAVWLDDSAAARGEKNDDCKSVKRMVPPRKNGPSVKRTTS